MSIKTGILTAVMAILLSGCVFNVRPETAAGIDDKPSAPQQEEQAWIELDAGDYDLTGMRLAWCGGIDMNGEAGFISLYVNASRSADGDFMFDDGQDWALLAENGKGVYPLFGREYVQLGAISCKVFTPEPDGGLTVVVERTQGAGIEIYECVYDSEKDAFLRTPVYDNSNINFLGNSAELNGQFFNPKLSGFEQYLDALPRSDKKEALEAFETMLATLSLRGEILPDEAVGAYLDYHSELIRGIELSPEFQTLGHTAEPDMQPEYEPYFIRLYQAEGSVFPASAADLIGKKLFDRVDWDYQEYFKLLIWQNENGMSRLANDGGLIVTWNQLADLIAKYQEFAGGHPQLARSRGLDEQLKLYTLWYTETGLDNSPLRDRNGALRPEVKASYEYFMETYPDSGLLGDVERAYGG